MRRLYFALWFFLLPLSPACFSQTLTIRVVNIANGHALPNVPIHIQPLYENHSGSNTVVSLITEANGEVRFVLSQPTPPHISIRADLKDKLWYCACGVMADTADIVRKGLLSESPDDGKSPTEHQLKPNPGEVYILAQPTPWWVRLLYPLEKD